MRVGSGNVSVREDFREEESTDQDLDKRGRKIGSKEEGWTWCTGRAGGKQAVTCFQHPCLDPADLLLASDAGHPV